MSNSTIQSTNHAGHPGERPLNRSSSLHSSPPHTTEHQHPQRGPSTLDYHQAQDYNQHQPTSLALHQQQHHDPHSLRLESFDQGFQLPSTQALALLPMPVAYEDFQYALPAIEPVDLPLGSSDLQASHPDSVYQSYPHTSGCGAYAQDYQLSFPSSWGISPGSRDQLPSPHLTQDPILSNFLHDALANQQSNLSASIQAPPPPPGLIESINPPASNQLYSSHYFPSSCVSSHSLSHYPPPNPATPPPLFDASEQDLLSSFLNILGESNGECEFDPQGMPEGMPVIGELKRRLEGRGQEGEGGMSFGKREMEDAEMGRAVESRLKLTEPPEEYDGHPHLRRPSLQSFQTTSGSLSSSSDSHLTYPEPDAQRRKKFKPSIDPLVQPGHLPEVPLHIGGPEPEPDVEMHSWTRINPEPAVGEWPGHIQQPYPHPAPPPPPLEQHPSPVFPSDATGPHDPPPSGETDPTRRPAKKAAKPVKATHIVSEQRRRNAIQGGFGSLVEILRAGESQSGISIATPDPPPPGASATPMSAQNIPKKPKTRGRGRRGEIETGASKSVVLERAAEFVVWMADGNAALSSEISRLENILLSHRIQV
ncbi:hypothetical protein, variant [Puccinia triticina 1-1 BBBD Race 1]|uniref:BHLH domain-containing protein n=2 Tax=Puccinia triticina TaxID=208348 RepID=A0A180GHC6_PUCT1|nr:uncharacterized protein PtA15_3A287 [Puccinia triticina]OAV92146.1 hypothetical protein PTTG_03689 [Puccinia triticina 1-1 BBBD Race 1]OAV92147.1 hypothetical protein, variant [Puccinia triticina 1-1 BBBD Race 1]WAQ82922.1 hypothetical protein PtA15_3A287 [Puccinia triticina]